MDLGCIGHLLLRFINNEYNILIQPGTKLKIASLSAIKL
jgi:hypothetical protein